jgi:hypothetical protein
LAGGWWLVLICSERKNIVRWLMVASLFLEKKYWWPVIGDW